MAELFNLGGMTTATTGTGTITLGTAVDGHVTFANAGVTDGDEVIFTIRDGANSEHGVGTYTASGTTLSRDTVRTSTNGGAKISLSGNAEVFLSIGSDDIRTVPQSGAQKTGSYTLVAGDTGQNIRVGTGGSITVPNSTMASDDIVTIINETGGDITITGSITTMYLAGTDGDNATLTLAARGIATVFFNSATVCTVQGDVS